MFTVIAQYHAQLQHAEQVAELLPQLALHSRTEPGNIAYTVSRDLERPEHFVIVEIYDSAENFAAHRDTEHFQTIGLGQIIPLLQNREVSTFSAPDAQR